jgi:1,4-alpha-glucan branching enzyme
MVEGCDSLYLVGDFNDWNSTAHSMQRNDDGSWTLTLELEPGRDYQFRYCTGDGAWHNDPAADGYVANPFGSENSVVCT